MGVWAIGGVLCAEKENEKCINYNTRQAIDIMFFSTHESSTIDLLTLNFKVKD